MPSHHRYNYIFANTPSFTHPYLHKIVYNPAGLLGPPGIIPGLRNAPWMGTFKVPTLTPPNYRSHHIHNGNQQVLTSPAVLMLHIFSTSTSGSRRRRNLIRQLDLMDAVPEEYRHLIEIKFVMGNKTESEQEEEEIRKEIKMYGDVIRLKSLKGMENMNNGKSWEWLRYVGRQGGRKAWWVMKCDDDTLPILPNLIPTLLSLNPTEPGYVGSAFGRWTGYQYYFQGMMYGFSWGVVKTMAVADVPASTRNSQWDEDARMGSLMFSLPLSPTANPNSTYCSPPPGPNIIYSLPPPVHNPCTGLMRYDMGSKIGQWQGRLIDDATSALAWHELKSDEAYINAYAQAKEQIERSGREYKWVVPDTFEPVAEV
ncbi:hypothetical protein V866_006097 [Kwoniella sp. B9012]